MRHISEKHKVDTRNKHGVFCPSCSNSCLRVKYSTHVCPQPSSLPPIPEFPTIPGHQREREPFDSTSHSVLTPGLLSSTLLEGTGDSSRISNPITPGCLFQKGRTAHPFYAGLQNFANFEDQSLYFLEPFDSWEQGKKDTYDKYTADILDAELKLSSCQRCFVPLGKRGPPRGARNPAFTQIFCTNHAKKLHKIHVHAKFTQSRWMSD